jgi:hypothetical protein
MLACCALLTLVPISNAKIETIVRFIAIHLSCSYTTKLAAWRVYRHSSVKQNSEEMYLAFCI